MGSQELVFEKTAKRNQTSRRTHCLAWLTEARRLQQINIYIRESHDMRRGRRTEGMVKFMKGKTETQPNFTLNRALRCLQGSDFLYALRGMKDINMYDYDKYIQNDVIKKVRDYTFLKDLNDSVRRPKSHEEAMISRLSNLASTTPRYNALRSEYAVLERFLPVLPNLEQRWGASAAVRPGQRIIHLDDSDSDIDDSDLASQHSSHDSDLHSIGSSSDSDGGDSDNDSGIHHMDVDSDEIQYIHTQVLSSDSSDHENGGGIIHGNSDDDSSDANASNASNESHVSSDMFMSPDPNYSTGLTPAFGSKTPSHSRGTRSVSRAESSLFIQDGYKTEVDSVNEDDDVVMGDDDDDDDDLHLHLTGDNGNPIDLTLSSSSDDSDSNAGTNDDGDENMGDEDQDEGALTDEN